MAMQVRHKRETDASLIKLDARWSRVEAIADGAIIADGVLLDIRGAHGGHTLTYRPTHFTDGFGKLIEINRTPAGVYSALVEDAHGGGTAINTNVNVTSYPHAVVGATGQTSPKEYSENRGGTEGKKIAARFLHTQLNAWADGLDRYSRGVPHAHVVKGHDFLYQAHRACFLVMTGAATGGGWAGRNDQQRIAWAFAMAQGAADTTNPLEFYERAGALTAPTVPKAWVDRNATRLNLSAAITINGTVATDLDIVGAGWIDDIDA